jgi:hypothetical protein
MSGVKRHRVNIEWSGIVEERCKGKVIGTRLTIVLSGEPLGVEVVISGSKHSFHKLLGFIEFDLTLNIIGCLVVLGPQAIDRNIN